MYLATGLERMSAWSVVVITLMSFTNSLGLPSLTFRSIDMLRSLLEITFPFIS